MAGQDFKIQQLKYDGAGGKYVVDNQGLLFTWNAKEKTIPRAPWSFGLEQRSSLENYPGSGFEPVEQVLGPNWEQFTLTGMWDDRWAGKGFAEEERVKLEQLVAEGGPVRITFESLHIDGIVKNVNISYFTSFRMGYSITVSPHFRDQEQLRAAYPIGKATATQDYSQLLGQLMALMSTLHSLGPVSYMTGSLYATVTTRVTDIAARIDAIADVIGGRVLSIGTEAVNSVLKVAADMDGLRGACLGLRDDLADASTTTDIVYEEPVLSLGFDAWVRELCSTARATAVLAYEASQEMRRRAQPDAQALYRPRAGESLYDIANQFFGSLLAWRAIAERNDLYQMELDGTELLTIPAKV